MALVSRTDLTKIPAAVSDGPLQMTNMAPKIRITRSEKVYDASRSGTVKFYSKETEKTRKGFKLADIYAQGSGTSSCICESTGFISFYHDGYEDYFAPDKLASLNFEELDALEITVAKTEEGEIVQGDPLYKLISSDTWYMAFKTDAETAQRYEAGKSVKVEIGDIIIPASVSSVNEAEDGAVIVLSTSRFWEDFAKVRKADICVITKDYEGLLAPASAVGEEDGNPGVYVKKIDGTYSFTRVKVLVESDGMVVLAQSSFTETDAEGKVTEISSVKLYDEVLRNAD